MSISGTLRQVKIDGRSFAVEADNEPEYTPNTEVTGEAHSFGTRKKITRTVAILSGLEINIESSVGDDVFLEDLNKRTDNYDLLWQNADTNAKGGLGFISELKLNQGKSTATLSFTFVDEKINL